MKYTAAVIFAFSIFINACNNNGSNNVKGKDAYETTKETLEQVEQKNPGRFLKIWVKDKKNLIGQTVVQGVISNNAKWLLLKILTLSFLILVKRVLWCSRTELLFMTVWRRGKA
ncbi:MAG: hypothetical protein IPI36_02730 [Chitinophagaceae bacterium]|nr:hypothetical protein [Chitinophagaceae bacterium]